MSAGFKCGDSVLAKVSPVYAEVFMKAFSAGTVWLPGEVDLSLFLPRTYKMSNTEIKHLELNILQNTNHC